MSRIRAAIILLAFFFGAVWDSSRSEAAVSRGWPFVMHIEFAGLLKQEGRKRRDLFMKEFERLLDDYPRHPFVLNKVGQLPAAARAIAHGNAERFWRLAPPKTR